MIHPLVPQAVLRDAGAFCRVDIFTALAAVAAKTLRAAEVAGRVATILEATGGAFAVIMSIGFGRAVPRHRMVLFIMCVALTKSSAYLADDSAGGLVAGLHFSLFRPFETAFTFLLVRHFKLSP